MNQLNLFAQAPSETIDSSESVQMPKSHHWQLFVDGASRNNPGKAGAGIYILKDGHESLAQGFFLGIKTNNQAEYLATVIGLYFIKQQFKTGDKLTITTDSLLVVRQVEGTFKVRKHELMPLHALAVSMMRSCNGTIRHVLRHLNEDADRMANEGVDTQNPVPTDILHMLSKHGISL